MKHKILKLTPFIDQVVLVAQAIQRVSTQQAISLSEAFFTQKASIDNRNARREKQTGYKLGFTSKTKMAQMRVHDIIWGRLMDAMEINKGTTILADAATSAAYIQAQDKIEGVFEGLPIIRLSVL